MTPHDAEMTFNRVCLLDTWNGLVQGKVEEGFGRHMSGPNTRASKSSQIFLLSRTLVNTGLYWIAGAPSPEVEKMSRDGCEMV